MKGVNLILYENQRNINESVRGSLPRFLYLKLFFYKRSYGHMLVYNHIMEKVTNDQNSLFCASPFSGSRLYAKGQSSDATLQGHVSGIFSCLPLSEQRF